MKKDIHPTYVETAVTCTCGNTFTTRSTAKGGTMRLGNYSCILQNGTLAARLYGREKISERHRHRYEFNMKYREQMTEKGFIICGTSPDGMLAELIELRDHPYFVGCQYHPEFQSKPNKPHPLFSAFLRACLAHQD